MALSSAQKKDLKRIGHHLKPIVIISEQGVSEGVLAELDRREGTSGIAEKAARPKA